MSNLPRKEECNAVLYKYTEKFSIFEVSQTFFCKERLLQDPISLQLRLVP